MHLEDFHLLLVRCRRQANEQVRTRSSIRYISVLQTLDRQLAVGDVDASAEESPERTRMHRKRPWRIATRRQCSGAPLLRDDNATVRICGFQSDTWNGTKVWSTVKLALVMAELDGVIALILSTSAAIVVPLEIGGHQCENIKVVR